MDSKKLDVHPNAYLYSDYFDTPTPQSHLIAPAFDSGPSKMFKLIRSLGCDMKITRHGIPA